ncbi:cyclic lactone autoinducer peptide [Cohnella sp. GCM10027633]
MRKSKVALLLSKALALCAIMFVSTASYWYIYRPQVPNELKRK